MERLSGLDAAFLYLETPTLLMHTLKLVLLDPLERPTDVRARLIAETRSRLHLFPLLRRRLLKVPFGLHHPLWIESSEVDLESHVRHIRLAPPGGPRELDAAMAEIASRPLDRSRPLWELWTLEGRADGALAVLVKLHHALADGATALRLLEALTSHHRLVPPITPPSKLWQPERTPSDLELVRDAMRDQLRALVRLPSLCARTWSAAAALRHRPSAPRPPRPMLDAPGTSFNRSLSAHRSLATLSLPLAAALRVKTTAHVTLNDVVLTLVGSALRGYLLARGELPDRALIASVPSSAEAQESQRLSGNRVSTLFTTLATDVSDDWQRLLVIHEVTRQAKHVQQLVPAALLGDWLQLAVPKPASWIVSQWSKRRIADYVPPPVNVVVAYVRGPSEPLFVQGRPVRALYSVGPILEGIGVNVTVWSYVDKLHFTVLSCSELTPDPHRITALLERALALLLAAANARSGPTEASLACGPPAHAHTPSRLE